jgi:hypothetical protein
VDIELERNTLIRPIYLTWVNIGVEILEFVARESLSMISLPFTAMDSCIVLSSSMV